MNTRHLPLLDIRGATKSYGSTLALRGVDLHVAAGDVVCLLGPSGCGKTTLLRVIAGLEQLDSGEVLFDGAPITAVPPHRRGFGLMFQEYALFPHRNVAENIGFGLRMQGKSPDDIRARVDEMLALVGLEGYGARRVFELSGGERQRVALARSLAPSPRLLMLDEPLGALDRTLRERLLDELRAILKQIGVTSIYVTHDQAEAYAIADWVVLMRGGTIVQQGAPEAVYRQPNSPFVARFLGLSNLVPGRVLRRDGQGTLLDTPLGSLLVAATSDTNAPTVVVRPEAGVLAGGGEQNTVSATVQERSFRGSRTRLTVRHVSNTTLELDLDAVALPEVGQTIQVMLRPDALSLISGEA